jgi:hypothetical protein
MNKTTKNISKNYALPVVSQGESEIYGAKKNPITVPAHIPDFPLPGTGLARV